jgi:uncharacterized tellurite resistance protein B-like protein
MAGFPEDPHPARDLPPDRRMDYLRAVAAMVYADGRVDDLELQVIRRLGHATGLGDDEIGNVVQSIRSPDRARIDAILASFAGETIRLALLGDAILVAFADGRVAAGESKEIAEYAEALGIETSQAVMIGRYVEEILVGNEGGELSRALADGLAEASAQIHPPRGVRWLYRKLTEHPHR